MIRKFYLTLIFGLLSAPSLLAAGYAPPEGVPMIRVAVVKDAPAINVSVRGPYSLYDGQNGREFNSARRLLETEVRPSAHGIFIGPEEYLTNKLRFEVRKDVTLSVNEQSLRFRGWLEIIKKDNNNFLVVNILDLEAYIRGVLYHEVSNRWPMDAMKAQAVAARTYALYQIRQNSDLPFDVTNDIYSQVYGGRSAERYRTNIAVDRTEGEILVYNGDVLPAYFHANSGGYTEDVSELWEHDLAPLKGQPDPYSEGAPSYLWRKNFRSKDVQDILNAKGYEVGLIKEIKVSERNRSGRIRTLEIVSRDGRSVRIPGRKFREIVGPNVIKSNNYEIVMQGYFFDLIGRGWGHGVGMSQWGAHNMAEERMDYDAILQFYYPGTQRADYREFKFPPVKKDKKKFQASAKAQ